MKRKILIVDDEKSIVNIISYNLKKEDFDVIVAYDGEEGLNLALTENPELILLDIMMPKLDGFEVCKRLRGMQVQIPIIMLTARAEEIDKVLGFEIGADDYVTKPFGIRELVARIKANLRRRENLSVPKEIQTENYFVVSDLLFDMDLKEIRRNGKSIELTRREFELTKFLATQKHQIFSREILMEKVWGYEAFGDARTVDVTIRRLRSKLEENPDKPKYILTKRGMGYYFNG